MPTASFFSSIAPLCVNKVGQSLGEISSISTRTGSQPSHEVVGDCACKSKEDSSVPMTCIILPYLGITSPSFFKKLEILAKSGEGGGEGENTYGMVNC